MRQIPLVIATAEPRSFANFLPGANALALDLLGGLAPTSTPVYLWGPSGSGKTHLLQATASAFESRGATVASFTAADAAPWPIDESASLVVFDDCDRFDAAQQQAAFALFVASPAAAIIAAGRVPPVDLAVREDLRSRLGWGHVLGLRPLSDPEARAALRREADRRGVLLADEVMDYLLTHFDRDLKHLMAQLDELDRFALATKRSVTVPLLKQMLAASAGTGAGIQGEMQTRMATGNLAEAEASSGVPE
jgi:DnaA family protein